MAATTKPVLREFQPLTNVLQTVPQRLQKGLFSQDVEWTCLDVTKEFLAIGTNVGIVFLYDRQKRTVERLQCPVRDSYSCGDSSTDQTNQKYTDCGANLFGIIYFATSRNGELNGVAKVVALL